MPPYVGEIRMFAGSFPPRGWQFCDGQPQAITENEPLFQLIGTTYGGDGETTFNLPDLRGRLPLHSGSGGLQYGDVGGVESHTLTNAELAAHVHTALGSTAPATTREPTGALPATAAGAYYRASPVAVTADNRAITQNAGSQPHDNVMPFLCVSFIISLYGIYPQPT